ncbi:hypothetical protein AFLA_007718 [Aspergillus flavus NRRL3357]|nr:hypothetical protein AFLA_007718 [Aspergillus flavus NRRL3357]
MKQLRSKVVSTQNKRCPQARYFHRVLYSLNVRPVNESLLHVPLFLLLRHMDRSCTLSHKLHQKTGTDNNEQSPGTTIQYTPHGNDSTKSLQVKQRT